MKTLHCPLCDRLHRVADNVLAAYCNDEHMMDAFQHGLPAEDGLVYPIGRLAWLQSCCDLCVELDLWITGKVIDKFCEHYAKMLSPADAVFAEFGVHL